MEKTNTTQGYIYPFLLTDNHARGSIIRLGQEFQSIIDKHQYPTCINNIIGELCILGISLVADIKTKGTLTLQITQGALVSMVVAEVNSDGHIRGCANFDNDNLATFLENNPNPTFQDLFKGGQFILTTRYEHTSELQQAIIDVTGNTLSQCMEHYFTQSAQIPTAIQIVTSCNISENNKTYDNTHIIDMNSGMPLHTRSPFLAAGMVLQQLPKSQNDTIIQDEDHDDNCWDTLNILIHTLKNDELLSPTISPDMLLHRLFHEYKTMVFSPKEIQFKCTCSKERLYKILNNFDTKSREEMIINNKIEAGCQFCGTIYTFNHNEFDTQ